MAVEMITLGLILAITMLCVVWWCIKCYFGNAFATIIIIIITGVLIILANKWLGEPTENEIIVFNEKRKGVGY